VYSSQIRGIVALACVGLLAVCYAGGSSIGIAMINGTATVDNAAVRGNASVMDGSVVETGKGSSQLSLQNGARIDFGAASRGKIYHDHVILEKGMGQLHAGSDFSVFANALRVVSSDSNSTVRVAVKDSKRIQVGAVSGEAKVLNGQGLLLAKVMPGRIFEFDQEAGAAAQARVSGCVERRGGKYYVRDETTNVISEITGPGLDQYVRKHVDVTGSIDTTATPGAGATQVVRVSTGGVSGGTGTGCPAGYAGAAGAAGAGTAGAVGAGLSTGAVVAIVGGVAVASILGGLAASGEFSQAQSGQ